MNKDSEFINEFLINYIATRGMRTFHLDITFGFGRTISFSTEFGATQSIAGDVNYEITYLVDPEAKTVQSKVKNNGKVISYQISEELKGVLIGEAKVIIDMLKDYMFSDHNYYGYPEEDRNL